MDYQYADLPAEWLWQAPQGTLAADNTNSSALVTAAG
jgi:hypothetical protein